MGVSIGSWTARAGVHRATAEDQVEVRKYLPRKQTKPGAVQRKRKEHVSAAGRSLVLPDDVRLSGCQVYEQG
jgi:hypothetical protein